MHNNIAYFSAVSSANSSVFKTSPATALLKQLDLADYEAEYHWSQFEELVEEASRHLDLHDAALARRRQLSHQVSQVLAAAVLP